MAYGTYSRGFRSGGYAARRSRISSAGAYDPEYVDMFEAGLKALALEDRLRANAAIYRNDYKDYQAQVNRVGNRFDTRVLNAAEAQIDGVELEVTALLWPAFRVDATFAYADAQITKVDLDASLEANFSAGHRLPHVSKYTLSISPQLVLSLGNGGGVLVRLDYSYRDDFLARLRTPRSSGRTATACSTRASSTATLIATGPLPYTASISRTRNTPASGTISLDSSDSRSGTPTGARWASPRVTISKLNFQTNPSIFWP